MEELGSVDSISETSDETKNIWHIWHFNPLKHQTTTGGLSSFLPLKVIYIPGTQMTRPFWLSNKTWFFKDSTPKNKGHISWQVNIANPVSPSTSCQAWPWGAFLRVIPATNMLEIVGIPKPFKKCWIPLVFEATLRGGSSRSYVRKHELRPPPQKKKGSWHTVWDASQPLPAKTVCQMSWLKHGIPEIMVFDSYWEREAFQDIHSLKLTAISPLKIGRVPKGNVSSSIFRGYSLVSGWVLLMDMPILQQLRCPRNTEVNAFIPEVYAGGSN